MAPAMTILMPAALFSIVPVLLISYNEQPRTFYLNLTGFALFIVALLVTMLVEVPIVKQIETWAVSTLPDISNNVDSVKSFLDRLLHPLRRVFSFVVFLWPSVDNHGSPVIFRSVSVRPTHLFDPISDHDYSFKLPLARERDAHSSGRRTTSHHVRYRAVPRAN